jgi:hypothetical protein
VLPFTTPVAPGGIGKLPIEPPTLSALPEPAAAAGAEEAGAALEDDTGGALDDDAAWAVEDAAGLDAGEPGGEAGLVSPTEQAASDSPVKQPTTAPAKVR